MWSLPSRTSQSEGDEIGFHFLILFSLPHFNIDIYFCPVIDQGSGFFFFARSLTLPTPFLCSYFFSMHCFIIWISRPTLSVNNTDCFLSLRDVPDVAENKKKDRFNAFFTELRAMIQAHGYPIKGDRSKTSQRTTAASQEKEGLIWAPQPILTGFWLAIWKIGCGWDSWVSLFGKD